jgi:hypothetical protein
MFPERPAWNPGLEDFGHAFSAPIRPVLIKNYAPAF